MGEREARWRTGQIVFQGVHPALRLTASSWLAGTALTAAAASGVLVGRLLSGEALGLAQWCLAVAFIPALALCLGSWSGTGKVFEVVYPIWWYLGPFNRENGLAAIDFLGLHERALVNTAPTLVLGLTLLLLCLAYLGRRRAMMI